MDKEEIKHRILFGTSSDVGYGKPPQQSRFQKGQSGNPRGRPKKETDDFALRDQPTLGLIAKIAERTVPVRDESGMSEMSMRERRGKGARDPQTE